MRIVAALLAIGTTGCQLVFSVDGPPQPPPPLLPEGCSPTSLITEGFGTAGQLPSYWTTVAGGGGVLQVGGELQIDTVGETTATLRPFLELRENAVSIQVFIPGTLATDNVVQLELLSQNAPGNRLVMAVDGTRLVATRIEDEGGVPTVKDVGEIPYNQSDPAVRIWRIRNDGTTTFWEVSGDGNSFTTLFDLEGLDYVGFMQATLRVRAASGTMMGRFDNFNGGIAAEGEACPADALVDDFEDDVIADYWRPSTDRCAFSLASGALQASVVGTTPDEVHLCMIETSTLYNLREHPITLEVGDIDTDGSLADRVLFVVRTLEGREAAFEQKGGQLIATAETQNLEQTGYLTNEHRFWRLGATPDDDLVWEVSENGVEFDQFAITQLGSLGPLDAVFLTIGFEGRSVEPTTVRFEGVNAR